MAHEGDKLEAVSAQLEWLRAVLDNVGAYVFTKDTAGRYTYANGKVCELFGQPLERIIGADDGEFFDMEKSLDLRRHDRRVLETGETIESEERNFLADTGDLKVYKSVKIPLRDQHDRIIGILGVSTDITELNELREELLRQSRTDSLTGLFNRRFFLEVASRELARSRRYGEPLSVMLIDIDHFKHINDTHGHHAGDRVLCEMASLCAGQIRTSDVLARIGGEEFAVLLPNTVVEDGRKLAERLRTRVETTEHTGDWQGGIRHTISIGLAALGRDDGDFERLLMRADKALYRAKNEGRNRVCTA